MTSEGGGGGGGGSSDQEAEAEAAGPEGGSGRNVSAAEFDAVKAALVRAERALLASRSEHEADARAAVTLRQRLAAAELALEEAQQQLDLQRLRGMGPQGVSQLSRRRSTVNVADTASATDARRPGTSGGESSRRSGDGSAEELPLGGIPSGQQQAPAAKARPRRQSFGDVAAPPATTRIVRRASNPAADRASKAESIARKLREAEVDKVVAKDVAIELELQGLREERVTLRAYKKMADERAEEHKEILHKIEQRNAWMGAMLSAYKAAVEREVGDGKAEELWKASQKHVTAETARNAQEQVERWERGVS